MGVARAILLRASRSKWLAHQFQRRAFTRRASRRFIPGEDLDAALAAAESFRAHDIASLVTLLGENVRSEADACAVCQHYVGAINRIAESEVDCQVSVKLTQMGLDVSDSVCLTQLLTLSRAAAATRSLVWVDMEGSGYVDRTLELVSRGRAEHENLGVCIQAYLHRSAEDLERLLADRIPTRLVKGAYREPAAVALQRKADVDLNFSILAERMLGALASRTGGFAAFGTHDMRLVNDICDLAAEKQIGRELFEFEMLYGIGRDHQLALAADGFTVRVLVSYGKAWFAWYMRRLAERPANVWFVLRNLVPQ